MFHPGSDARGVVELWMLANLVIALLLGWAVGYERYFKGRAAGSQVYCLVCVTSCAVNRLRSSSTNARSVRK